MSYLYSFVVYLYVNGGGSIALVGEDGAVCLLLFACGYVVSVWRGFLFLWVLWMGYVVLLWRSLSLPCGCFSKYTTTVTFCVHCIYKEPKIISFNLSEYVIFCLISAF